MQKILNMSNFLLILILLSLNSCIPFIVGTTVTTVGYITRNEKGIGGKISDTELTCKINNVLNKLDNSVKSNIFYVVKNSEVLLTGLCNNNETKEYITNLIASVPNISNVYNEINIGANYSTLDNLSDNLIIADFNARAMINANTKFLNYKIIAFKFNIYLIGTVKNKEELNYVIGIAKSLVGVKKIISYLKIIEK